MLMIRVDIPCTVCGPRRAPVAQADDGGAVQVLRSGEARQGGAHAALPDVERARQLRHSRLAQQKGVPRTDRRGSGRRRRQPRHSRRHLRLRLLLCVLRVLRGQRLGHVVRVGAGVSVWLLSGVRRHEWLARWLGWRGLWTRNGRRTSARAVRLVGAHVSRGTRDAIGTFALAASCLCGQCQCRRPHAATRRTASATWFRVCTLLMCYL